MPCSVFLFYFYQQTKLSTTITHSVNIAIYSVTSAMKFVPTHITGCVLILFCNLSQVFGQVGVKSYLCDEGKCRLLKRGAEGLSHAHCLMTCGAGMLWPYPSSIDLGNEVVPIASDGIRWQWTIDNVADMNNLVNLYEPTFKSAVYSHVPPNFQENSAEKFDVQLNVEVLDVFATTLTLDTDESYSLSIDNSENIVTASITAATYFGARHAIESLSQLIGWDNHLKSLVMVSKAQVKDAPAFPYRGVMLDTSRHFLPIPVIQRTVRAMSYNKMNVLHLHLTDTASFPVHVSAQPNMTSYGAYSDLQIFSPQEMADLTEYAQAHGVMILPEVDTPAHVSAGWQWGEDSVDVGELILCADPDGTGGAQWTTDSLEPPSGQLNLANDKIYDVLADVYAEVLGNLASASGIFHMGGDEVIIGSDSTWASCYNNTMLGAPILQLLAEKGLSREDPESFYGLWQNFTMRATDIAREIFDRQSNGQRNLRLHIWGGGGAPSDVTYNMVQRPDVTKILPPELFTIQVWDESDKSLTKWLIGQGYDVVLSNTDYVYLDCGNAGFTNPGGYWCQPYHEWFHMYDYVNDVISMWDLSEEDIKKVRGVKL
jgi:hexosaminidase